MIANPERWLLDWLLRINPAHEPLCGDLIEECRRGRSRLWVWRQLANAFGVTATGRVRGITYETAEAWMVDCAILAALVFQGYVAMNFGAALLYLAWRGFFAST